MQMKNLLSYSLVSLAFPLISHASSYVPIGLSELQNKSTHIVVAKVVKVDELSKESHTGRQRVFLKVFSQLKGKATKDIKFRSNYKGLVDFDPKFEVGQKGVFFLKKKDSQYSLSHFGSAAIFMKDTFK